MRSAKRLDFFDMSLSYLMVVEDVGPRDEGAAVDEHHHGQVRSQVVPGRISGTWNGTLKSKLCTN